MRNNNCFLLQMLKKAFTKVGLTRFRGRESQGSLLLEMWYSQSRPITALVAHFDAWSEFVFRCMLCKAGGGVRWHTLHVASTQNYDSALRVWSGGRVKDSSVAQIINDIIKATDIHTDIQNAGFLLELNLKSPTCSNSILE